MSSRSRPACPRHVDRRRLPRADPPVPAGGARRRPRRARRSSRPSRAAARSTPCPIRPGRTIFFTTDGPARPGDPCACRPPAAPCARCSRARRSSIRPGSPSRRTAGGCSSPTRARAASSSSRATAAACARSPGSAGTRPRGLDIQRARRGRADRLHRRRPVRRHGRRCSPSARAARSGRPCSPRARRCAARRASRSPATARSTSATAASAAASTAACCGSPADQVTTIARSIRLGNPAGVALTRDGSTLLVSSLAPAAGTAQVLLSTRRRWRRARSTTSSAPTARPAGCTAALRSGRHGLGRRPAPGARLPRRPLSRAPAGRRLPGAPQDRLLSQPLTRG